MSTPYGAPDPAQQQAGPPGAYSPGPYPPQGGYAPYPPQGSYGQGPYGQQEGYLHGGPVGFGEAISQAFRNMFNYQGRASRSAYWWFALFNVLTGAGVGILAAVFIAAKVPAISILLYLAAVIVSILVTLPLGVRRLHDQDKSGFWYFIVLVPFVGGICLLVFMLLEGTPGPNRFG